MCTYKIVFSVSKLFDLILYDLINSASLICAFAVTQVTAWARQHQQRLSGALSELMATQELLENLLSWLQWAEATLTEKDKEALPQEIEEIKALITDHQVPVIRNTFIQFPQLNCCFFFFLV